MQMISWSILASLFILLTLLSSSPVRQAFGQEILEDILALGKDEGIDASSTVSPETLQKIMQGVEKGNKENIYFYGLLKLYGIAVTKDVPGAAQQFKRAASLGHRESTTAYGVMMMTGITGEKNYVEAVRYFKDGVARGDSNAHWLLGKMLMEGKGVPVPSYLEAAVYFQKAADEGIVQAQHNLALMYEYGMGIKQDLSKASELYETAAEQNYVESMYNLALMYAYGRGFPQDYQRARSLFDAGARMNHAPSMYYIGIYKMYGYGCNINYDQAINWFERAASLDDYRISNEAAKAAKELKGMVEAARDQNERFLDKLQSMAERN